MLRIAICDDLEKELLSIEKLTTEYLSNSDVEWKVYKFSDPDQLLKSIEEGTKYDALLLDICMPGTSGVEIAKELLSQRIEILVVFLTTSKDYALQAFGVHAVRYLIKPLNKNEFFEAMDYIYHNIRDERRRTLIVKTELGPRTISYREILFCETEKNYTIFHLQNGENLRVRSSLAKATEELLEVNDFIGAGVSYIINLSHVRALEEKCVVLDNGVRIPIPRRMYTGFRQGYMDFFCREERR